LGYPNSNRMAGQSLATIGNLPWIPRSFRINLVGQRIPHRSCGLAET
jgi:hypothetical protein